jgi:hypothetical protein
MWMRTRLGPAISAVALTLAGCGPGNGLTMGRVSGMVTYKGAPVEFGEVLFVPDIEKGNTGVPSMGPIRQDGTYVMSTQDSGDGVIAGYHRVGIRALDPEAVTKDGAPAPAPDSDAAAGTFRMEDRIKQRKAQSLALRRNRAKADAPTVSFNGKAYRFLASPDLANPDKSEIRVQISRGSNTVNFDIAEDGKVKVTQ